MAITKINTPEIFDLGATNSSLRLPSGNTASRPSSPSTGEWRYNTDDNKVEYWDGSAWFQIDDESAASAFVPEENFSPTTYLGNGSTNVLSSKIGNAGYFNGSSSKIDVSPPPQDNSGAISISFWARTSSTSRATFFIFEYNSGGAAEFLKLENYGFGGTNSLRVTYDNTNSFNINNEAISDNDWHHIVVTAGNGNVKVYKDGSLLATNSVTITDRTITDFAIGYRKYNNDLYFNGGIDQVRVFNRELNETIDGEVTTLYNENSYSSTTKSTTDIFNDGSGVALYELDGNSLDTGSYPYGTGAIDSGQSADFNGSSHIYPNTSWVSSYPFSISAWVNTDWSSGNGQIINTSIGGTRVSALYKITSVSGWGNLGVFFGGSNHWTYDLGDTYTNQWVHLCVSITSANNFSLYVNGISVTPTNNGGSHGGTAANAIGSDGAGGEYFNGKIDQVRIYSSTLSASDAQALVSETNVPTTNLVAWYKLDGNANTSQGTNNGTWSGTEAYSAPADFPLVVYNGTPTNVGYQGTPFQPDLVWIKSRDASVSHKLFDSVRGVYKPLSSNGSDQEYNNNPYGLTSFDSNGFTIADITNGGYAINGAPGQTYTGTNAEYVAWCWKAGGTAVSGTGTNGVTSVNQSANTDAGFSIVEFSTPASGNGTATHGLSQTPEFIIYKRTSSTGQWTIYHSALGVNQFLFFTTIGATTDTGIWSTPSSTTIPVNVGKNVSASSDYIAYCFHSVDGYQRVSTYTGSGSSGKRVYTTDDGTSTGNGGFQPRFVMIKRYDSGTSENWILFDSLRVSGSNEGILYPNLSNAESSYSDFIDFNSDGFTMKDGGGSRNAASGNYIYLAIA